MVWSHDLFKFWEITDNIPEMVHDRDIVTMKTIQLHACQ